MSNISKLMMQAASGAGGDALPEYSYLTAVGKESGQSSASLSSLVVTFDISDPAYSNSLVSVWTIPDSARTYNQSYVTCTDLPNQRLFVANISKVRLWDIDMSNPTIPSISQTIIERINGLAYDPETDTLYAANDTDVLIEAYDASDLTTVKSSVSTAALYNNDEARSLLLIPSLNLLVATGSYASSGNTTLTIDISDPSNMSIIDTAALGIYTNANGGSKQCVWDETNGVYWQTSTYLGTVDGFTWNGTTWTKSYTITSSIYIACQLFIDVSRQLLIVGGYSADVEIYDISDIDTSIPLLVTIDSASTNSTNLGWAYDERMQNLYFMSTIAGGKPVVFDISDVLSPIETEFTDDAFPDLDGDATFSAQLLV